MSSYDAAFYHNVDVCIEAEHYISKSAGIYMEQTSDKAGVLNIYGYSNGGELTYNVNIPAAGDYTIRLRMLSDVDATLNIISASGIVTKIAPSTSNVWADRELSLSLGAGKQQLTFKITQGSLKLNYFSIYDDYITGIPKMQPTKNISFIQDALAIYIQAENGIAASKLFLIGGQLVASGVAEISTKGLTKGIYILSVKDVVGNIATFKIIVSK